MCSPIIIFEGLNMITLKYSLNFTFFLQNMCDDRSTRRIYDWVKIEDYITQRDFDIKAEVTNIMFSSLKIFLVGWWAQLFINRGWSLWILFHFLPVNILIIFHFTIKHERSTTITALAYTIVWSFVDDICETCTLL